jgi:integrase
MKQPLTDRGVLAVPAPASGRFTLWDERCPGLCLRVTPNAARSFFAVMRAPGDRNPSWIKVGAPPAMSVAEARKAARAALVALARNDPTKPKPLPPAPPLLLFGAVAEEFIEGYVSGLRTASAYTNRVRGLIGLWRGRPIASITRRDVIQLIEDRVRISGGNSARHLFSDMTAIFAWCCDRDLIEASPCAGVRAVKLHGRATQRDRVLTDDELAAIWAAAQALGGDYAAVIKLLMLSGQRRGQFGALQWPEVEADRILFPGARMKTGRPHILPLTMMMRELLPPRRLHGGRVFGAITWSRAKRRLDRLSGVADWCLHDLRRTCRTGLSALGVADGIGERILAHAPGGVRGVYDRHDYLVEMLEALLAWERRLMVIVGAEAKAAAD